MCSLKPTVHLANPDPLAHMAGERFSSVSGEDLSAYRFMEEIMKSPREEEEDENAAEKKLTLKFVMHVQKLDADLLQEYALAVSSYVSMAIRSESRSLSLSLILKLCYLAV